MEWTDDRLIVREKGSVPDANPTRGSSNRSVTQLRSSVLLVFQDEILD